MIIGVCSIKIHIPGSSSLKDKRRVLASIKDRIRQKFNASVAEVDAEDVWQSATLGVACVSGDKNRLAETMANIMSLVKNGAEYIVIDSQLDFL